MIGMSSALFTEQGYRGRWVLLIHFGSCVEQTALGWDYMHACAAHWRRVLFLMMLMLSSRVERDRSRWVGLVAIPGEQPAL